MVVPSSSSRSQQRGAGAHGSGIFYAIIIFVCGFFLGHMHAQLTNSAKDDSLIGSSLGSGIPATNCPPAVTATDATNGGCNREYGNGWHSIEAFYGKKNHLADVLPQDLEWFAQARQDEAVVTFLKQKKNGYFVDLAANDATILSNTYSLEQKYGWTGLCIEPNPMYWQNLTYRDCQVVAAVVGETRLEEVFFRFDAGDHGGIAGDQFNNKKRWEKSSLKQYTVTLVEILERFNAPKHIDYLSLDVEGAEDFIMHNFPLDKYSISLMTVERPNEELKGLLEKHGFRNIKRLSRWGETMWAHESMMESLDLSRIEEFTPTKEPKEEVKPEDANTT